MGAWVSNWVARGTTHEKGHRMEVRFREEDVKPTCRPSMEKHPGYSPAHSRSEDQGRSKAVEAVHRPAMAA